MSTMVDTPALTLLSSAIKASENLQPLVTSFQALCPSRVTATRTQAFTAHPKIYPQRTINRDPNSIVVRC